MARYDGPLESAFRLLKNERNTYKYKHARLTTGDYAGHKAKCSSIIISETLGGERLEFLYSFDVYRKDEKDFLSSEPGEVRRFRSRDEFEWI